MKKFISIWIIFFLSVTLLLTQNNSDVIEGAFFRFVVSCKHQTINISDKYLMQEVLSESNTTKLVNLSNSRIDKLGNYLVRSVIFEVGYHIPRWNFGIGVDMNDTFNPNKYHYSYSYDPTDPSIPCDGGKDCKVVFLRKEIFRNILINVDYNIFHNCYCGISAYFSNVVLSKWYDNESYLYDIIYNKTGFGIEFNADYSLIKIKNNADMVLVFGIGYGKSPEINFYYLRLGVGIFMADLK